jgi:hypothetical protein
MGSSSAMRTRETLLPLDEFILSIPLIVQFQALGEHDPDRAPIQLANNVSNNVPSDAFRNQISG